MLEQYRDLMVRLWRIQRGLQHGWSHPTRSSRYQGRILLSCPSWATLAAGRMTALWLQVSCDAPCNTAHVVAHVRRVDEVVRQADCTMPIKLLGYFQQFLDSILGVGTSECREVYRGARKATSLTRWSDVHSLSSQDAENVLWYLLGQHRRYKGRRNWGVMRSGIPQHWRSGGVQASRTADALLLVVVTRCISGGTPVGSETLILP